MAASLPSMGDETLRRQWGGQRSKGRLERATQDVLSKGARRDDDGRERERARRVDTGRTVRVRFGLRTVRSWRHAWGPRQGKGGLRANQTGQ